MKFAVIGAGAIGGYLGARLALAGEPVTFVARGANLEAIRRDGFKLIEADGTENHVRSVEAARIGEAGHFDVVLLAVKAHQVTALAAELPRALRPRDGCGHAPERRPLVVLPQVRRTLRGPAHRDGGSRRPDREEEEEEAAALLACSSSRPSGSSAQWSILPLNSLSRASSR